MGFDTHRWRQTCGTPGFRRCCWAWVRMHVTCRKVVRKIRRLGVGVQRPHERNMARRDPRAHLDDHAVGLILGAADPGDVVRAGVWNVRLEDDPVAGRLDDLEARCRRLAKRVGESDQPLLRYSLHGRIFAPAQAVGLGPHRCFGGRRRLAGALRCFRPRRRLTTTHHPRAGRRGSRRPNCRSRHSVCLARAGQIAEKAGV